MLFRLTSPVVDILAELTRRVEELDFKMVNRPLKVSDTSFLAPKEIAMDTMPADVSNVVVSMPMMNAC